MITKFRGEYAFLSNFYRCDVLLDGQTYPTVENAFQASKTLTLCNRKTFEFCTPVEAKKLSYKLDLRKDWEYIKDSLMMGFLWQKFVQNQHFQDLLIKTDHKYIIEGNTWNDRYWGCVLGTGDPQKIISWDGKNKLGSMIMIIRNLLPTNYGEVYD